MNKKIKIATTIALSTLLLTGCDSDLLDPIVSDMLMTPPPPEISTQPSLMGIPTTPAPTDIPTPPTIDSTQDDSDGFVNVDPIIE